MRKRMKRYLEARLNHGRWLINCPECNGAELYHGEPTFKCQNPGCPEYLKEKPAAVTKLKNEIDALVKNRRRENMNWNIGESLEQLKRENARNGVKF